MSTSNSAPFAAVGRGLTVAGLAGLAILTLADRGATRIYATPWNVLFTFIQLVPFAVLFMRGTGWWEPLRLPGKAWLAPVVALAAIVLLSACASPFRGPSVLAGLTPLAALATFLLLHDWLAGDWDRRKERVALVTGLFSVAAIVTSLGLWGIDVVRDNLLGNIPALIDHRNDHPLGHSNYTAGLALLALPWLGSLAWRSAGRARLGWAIATVLGLVVLASTGSRGGALGFCALLVVAVIQASRSWKRLLVGTLGAAAFAAALLVVNPRTRTLLFRHGREATELASSSVQRTAMLTAGWRMGRDRPVTGWGPGTTPLVYPLYRGGLDGGTEDVLQLHSTPLELWAGLGAAGIVATALLLAAMVRAGWRRREDPIVRTAAVALGGYAVMAATDWQLDVPVIAMSVATLAALLAAAENKVRPPAGAGARLVPAGAAVALGLVACFGRTDPAPEMNVRALTLAHDERNVEPAIALLRRSLAVNPAQEIAHFNLGWLLVVRDPAAAEKHFLAAARLVPDKGGVYFGLALARLNRPPPRGERATVRALALESLNDPLFLTSPWWRQRAFAALRPATFAEVRALAGRVAQELESRGDGRFRDARWVAGLADWIEGAAAPGEMVALAHTPERIAYFARRPAPPDFSGAPIRAYRRERTGYPVLMRNLDLPPPVDLFDVQENALASGELRFLFPAKGWLPGPVLLGLLDRTDSAKP